MDKNTKKNIIGGIVIIVMGVMLIHPVRVSLCKVTKYKVCIAIKDSAWEIEEIPQPGSWATKMTIRKLK